MNKVKKMIELTALKDTMAIIIPAYNAENTIANLLTRILTYVDNKQIIVVDDGSRDDTYNKAYNFGVVCCRHTQNKGKGIALQTGFLKAINMGYSYAITLDADLQHNPDHIPDFCSVFLRTNADLIIGKRNAKKGNMPYTRRLSNLLTSYIVSLITKTKIADSQSGYRLYNLEFIKNEKFTTSQYDFETEILLLYIEKKACIQHCPIDTIYADETSHISHGRDIYNFVCLVLRHLIRKRRFCENSINK